MRQWINLIEGSDPHQDLIDTIRTTDMDTADEHHIGAHADLKNEAPLPPETWLIHWTNSTASIGKEGFTLGQTDPAAMGITGGNEGLSYAKGPGYNFAYLANSRDARKGNGVYGHEALLFQARGVHIYHYGDDEEQVVFWGPDVDPSKIVHICPVMDKPYWWEQAAKWQVIAPGTKFIDGPDETILLDRPALFKGSFTKVVAWVTSGK
jgi:hypothetical protein